MSRKRTEWKMEATLARWEAEDRAVKLLWALPRQAAAVAAVRAAVELAREWERERHEMLLRNDPTPVYLFGEYERLWLLAAGAKCSEDPSWDSCPAAVEVRNHLDGLPPDEAALVSYNVAYGACRRAGIP